MSKILSTTDLIETALRRAMIPSDQATFTCSDILDILNEEMGIHVVPMVLRAHEEYYVYDSDIAVDSCTTKYRIPYRAIGNKLRDVQYVDDGGGVFEMTRVSIEDRPCYDQCASYGTNSAFYVQNDNIVLMDAYTSTGSIRMSYYLRPNDLVATTRAGQITAISTACCVTTYTVSTFPTHFSCTTDFDFIQKRSPNKIRAYDITVSCVNSSVQTLSFPSGCVSGQCIEVGDYILKAEETIYPQLPAELHPILAQRAAVKMLEALGDVEGMRMAQNELERMEYNAMALIDNRVEGAPQKIVNRHGALRNATSHQPRRRW